MTVKPFEHEKEYSYPLTDDEMTRQILKRALGFAPQIDSWSGVNGAHEIRWTKFDYFGSIITVHTKTCCDLRVYGPKAIVKPIVLRVKSIIRTKAKDERNRIEGIRRYEALLARAQTCHMSNTKWRKLFGALHALQLGAIRWKYVGDERIFEARVPKADDLEETFLNDHIQCLHSEYREIDWVEVPAENAAGVVEALARLGQYPVLPLESGVRIVGYSW